MIMNTISSYDEALDFYPQAKTGAAPGSSLLAKLRAVWAAMSESHAAAYRYRELVAHGHPADAAASRVFAEFYAR
jgi:hypothetical protein